MTDKPTSPEIRLTPEQRAYQAILEDAVRDAEERVGAKLTVHAAEEMGRYGEIIGALAKQETLVDRRMDGFSDQLGELAVSTAKLATAQATAGRRAGVFSGAVVSATITAIGGVLVALLTAQCAPERAESPPTALDAGAR
jgi:hypothetical protein